MSDTKTISVSWTQRILLRGLEWFFVKCTLCALTFTTTQRAGDPAPERSMRREGKWSVACVVGKCTTVVNRRLSKRSRLCVTGVVVVIESPHVMYSYWVEIESWLLNYHMLHATSRPLVMFFSQDVKRRGDFWVLCLLLVIAMKDGWQEHSVMGLGDGCWQSACLGSLRTWVYS